LIKRISLILVREVNLKMATTLHFCPTCHYYLALDITDTTLTRVCRHCGYNRVETEGTLVLETVVQEKASEGHKILLNEFTRQDPTLPHVSNIPCPTDTCPSRKNVTKADVIVIKSDPVNLKFLYICNVCGTQWRSRS
jgi:DNA-directed RNA polymerase subunit M/transcription elongation factor TFIIS